MSSSLGPLFSLFSESLPSPLQRLKLKELPAGHEVWLKRDDLLRPDVSGNKLRKLQGWLEQALEVGATGLASCGGPHSQHLLAMAFVGRALELTTKGYVRGQHSHENALLARCRALGMELVYIEQGEFRATFQNPAYRPPLPTGGFFVPMGAAGPEALPGIEALWQEVQTQRKEMNLPAFDALAVSAGTGTFAAGLLLATQGSDTQLWAFPAFRPDARLRNEIVALSGISEAESPLLSLHYRSDQGRFGRVPEAIERFAQSIQYQTGINLERVYEAKMLYGLVHRLNDHIQPEKRVLAFLSGAPLTTEA